MDTDAYVQGHERALRVCGTPTCPWDSVRLRKGAHLVGVLWHLPVPPLALHLLLLQGVDACGPGHAWTEDAASEEASDSPAGDGGVPFPRLVRTLVQILVVKQKKPKSQRRSKLTRSTD